MEKKEKYEALEMEVVVFEAEDVITASGESDPIVGPFVPAQDP